MRTIQIIKENGAADYAQALESKLSAAGFCVKTGTDLDETADAVVLAGAQETNAARIGQVDCYLKKGGKLIALGAPCFSNEIFHEKGQQKTLDERKADFANGGYEARLLCDVSDVHVLEHFQKDTYNPDSKKVEGGATLSLAPEGVEKNCCLAYQVDDFYINESFETEVSFEKGENAIGFYAKADSQTKTITIALVEQDGTIFKARITPSENYEYFLLTKRDFAYAGNRKTGFHWEDHPEYVDFSKVAYFQIGHALSHAYSVAGRHSFYIDKLCAGKLDSLCDIKYSIDGLYPEYKFYPVENIDHVALCEGQHFIKELVSVPNTLASISARAQGSGYKKGRRFRFVPIAKTVDEKGLLCGYVSYAIFNYGYAEKRATHDGSAILVYTPQQAAFYKDNIAEVANSIAAFLCPVRLVEGGADEYIYRDDQNAAQYGFVVAAQKDAALTDYTVELSYHEKTEIFQLGELEQFYTNGKLDFYRGTRCCDAAEGAVLVVLKYKGKEIDSISHQVEIHRVKPLEKRQYARIQKGENEIYIAGKPARFFGVNYMPSVCGGFEYGYEFEHYVSAEAYDPEIIERDLKRVKDIGINAVSIFFYYEPALHSNNILHLLSLCEKYGIFVNLSLRPKANPFDFSAEQVRTMIEKFRLDKLDIIVGYDIAWERYVGTYESCYGNYAGRKCFDEGFRAYLLNRYGSFAAVEQLTGCLLPRNEQGEVVGPSDDMLREDGAHNGIVAIFRSYIDNTVARAHIKAREFIRSIDPHHLVSARSGDASTIPLVDPGIYGYDYKAMSMGCDYVSPESYALSDDSGSMRQGVFTNIYARYANKDNVVQWMEFGKSIWIGTNFADNTLSKQWQADYYKKFFDMLLAGHTAGLFAWWWAGGYRIGENSDFGIVNPDGSDRPVTKVFREYADKFIHAPKLPKPTKKICFDRDLHADGLQSVYRLAEKELFEAVAQGESVLLCDDAFEKTSADVSFCEKGNFKANGYSPKYLDGFILDAVYSANGKVTALSDGDCLPASGCATLTIRYVNSEKSTWLKTGGYGTVSLVCGDKEYPLKESVEPNEIAVFEIDLAELLKGTHTFMLHAKERSAFGERLTLTICEA